MDPIIIAGKPLRRSFNLQGTTRDCCAQIALNRYFIPFRCHSRYTMPHTPSFASLSDYERRRTPKGELGVGREAQFSRNFEHLSPTHERMEGEVSLRAKVELFIHEDSGTEKERRRRSVVENVKYAWLTRPKQPSHSLSSRKASFFPLHFFYLALPPFFVRFLVLAQKRGSIYLIRPYFLGTAYGTYFLYKMLH